MSVGHPEASPRGSAARQLEFQGFQIIFFPVSNIFFSFRSLNHFLIKLTFAPVISFGTYSCLRECYSACLCGYSYGGSELESVFLLTATIVIIPVNRFYGVNTVSYSFQATSRPELYSIFVN